MNAASSQARAAVFGAGGYTGMLLSRLLLRHPDITLPLLASERLSSEGLAALGEAGAGPPVPPIRVLRERDAVAACGDLGITVALLSTPAELSLDLVPPLLAAGTRVLDLSGAFRLPDAA